MGKWEKIREPTIRPDVFRDEPDNRNLECAVEGTAEVIVPGDKTMMPMWLQVTVDFTCPAKMGLEWRPIFTSAGVKITFLTKKRINSLRSSGVGSSRISSKTPDTS